MSKIENIAARKIVKALKGVNSGQDVYEALEHVPTENLRHIRDMIDHIIEYRSLCPNCGEKAIDNCSDKLKEAEVE